MENDAGLWWMPGVLIGSVGVLAFVGGFATGGPDAAGGVVFGSVALAAAAVILWRRSSERGGSEPREDAKPNAASGRRGWWRFWGS